MPWAGVTKRTRLRRTTDRDRPTARSPLALCLLALVAGVLADRILAFGLTGWGCLAAFSLLASIAFRRQAGPHTATVLLLAFAVAACWHASYWNLYRSDELCRWAGRDPIPVCVEGRLLESPQTRRRGSDPLQPGREGERTRCRVAFTALRGACDPTRGHLWLEVSGQGDVWLTGRLEHVRVGDRVRIFGKLSRLRDRRNPGGFSPWQRGRSARRLTQLTVNDPACITLTATRPPLDVRWWLAGMHAACRRVLERHLEPPHASLAAAILLGDRDQLDPDQVDAFFVTGTVHLLAISGLHLAILVQAVFLVLRAISVPRPHRLALVMAVTIFYALLTGARPPVVRAAVLVCMLCLELLALRPRCSFNSLAAAGIVLLAMNPTHVFHIGVQLSFLAVATLIWMSRFERGRECRETKPSPPPDPSLRTYLGHKVRQHFRTTAIASVAIWLISLPLVAHQFHLIPLSGLVLNLFLLLPLAVALYSGLAVILLSWIPLFAGCCAWLCGHCLDVITGIVNGVSGCEFSHGWVPGPPVVGLASFYVIVLGFGAFRRFNGRWPVWLGLGFATLGLLLFCGHRKPDRGLECAFLAVGHGVCIVLELPNDEVWLYDAGSLGGVDSTLREISSFLWSRGITRLDGIVISHGDLDHFNVVPALIRRFSVRQICISPAIFQTADASLRELVAAIEREQIPVRYVARGAALSESPWGTMSVCFPDLHGFAEQDNANSVVLDIQYFQKRILLTGDLEGEGLARLLASEPLDCDIVMAPHHGSRHSRPSEVARWSRPEWVIVSGGDPRRAVEAMASYREAGARVLHTSHAGAITAVLKPDQVEVR